MAQFNNLISEFRHFSFVINTVPVLLSTEKNNIRRAYRHCMFFPFALSNMSDASARAAQACTKTKTSPVQGLLLPSQRASPRLAARALLVVVGLYTLREITQMTSRTAPSRRVCGEQLERSVKQLYSRCRIRDTDNSQSTHTMD